MLFSELELGGHILDALADEGYEQATSIQQQVIPAILQGSDLLACAATGTGKTAAFALPILHLLENELVNGRTNSNISALIVVPTRELAIQCSESFFTYGRYATLTHLAVFGGAPIEAQIESLQRGVDALIATPGRLLDIIARGFAHFDNLRFFVLDEADQMLNLGFLEDIKRIIAMLPEKKQTLLFSATMPEGIKTLAASVLIDPLNIGFDSSVVHPPNIKQIIYAVESKDKVPLLIHVLKNKEIKQVLVFTKTRQTADKLSELLVKASIKCDSLHSERSQLAREQVLSAFRDGKLRVLVATDIAARGIDVEGLKYVINYELPDQAETYIHRIGRTGRAGNQGNALTLCSPEEMDLLDKVKRYTGQEILFADHPYQISAKRLTKPVIFTSPTDVRKKARSGRDFGKKKKRS